MTNYREILRLASLGLSKTGIGLQLGCSRNTVADILGRAQKKNIRCPLPENLSDRNIEETLYPEKAAESRYKMPDYEKVHHEMGKPGVTFTLLWDEYCNHCRQNGEIPYAYTQFRYHYYEYVQTTKATMHITHKPGNIVEVDWAGTTCKISDSDTGEVIPAYVFVGVLPCSGYCYAEAFLTMNQESWINAHIHMFQFFGGVAKIITPDNLRVGVIKSDWYSPEINRSYNECAEYYGSVVIPARVKHPKDKASSEGAVGVITTWIIAALRNQKFFTLAELNEAIREKLKDFNEKPFQKKPGCRLNAYLEEEKEFMQLLPPVPYELAVWKKLIPGFNYHIEFEKNFYSVPYEYIKQEMDVRVTSSVIEVYYNNLRVCSHPRLYGKPGQYHTITEHMPEKHQKYLEWNSERFLSWAKSIGTYTETTIRAILASHKIEQQGYRACIGVLKLTDKYGVKRLENACQKALSYTPSPSFKSIDSILKTGQDKIKAADVEPKREDTSHAYIRGAEYYGRKK
jgi:transposase